MMSLLLILGLLLSPAVHAADLSDQCASALALSPAGSAYVGKVLKRVDAGLAFSRDQKVDEGISGTINSWIERVGSAWKKTVDPALDLTAATQDLTGKSACYRFDLLLIECKMDEVRIEMNKQLERGSTAAIQQLENLLEFTQERRRQLLLGGLDPGYRDPTWGNVQTFDTEDGIFCCEEEGSTCASMSEEECTGKSGSPYLSQEQCVLGGCKRNDDAVSSSDEMCPYHSNYTPPNVAGFGCDMEVLDALEYSSFDPIKAEGESTKLIMEELKKQRQSAQQFLSVQQEIDSLFGRSPTLPPPPKDREHLVAYGCEHRESRCSGAPDVLCATNMDCRDSDSTCMPLDKVCKGNRNIGCFNDEQCNVGGTDVGPCIDDEGERPFSLAVRGAFSLDKEPVLIMREFLARRMVDANARAFPDDIKEAGEFSSEQSSLADQRSTEGVFASVRASMRALWRVWDTIQGRQESPLFAIITDPQLEVAHGLSNLTDAVSTLSKLANKKDGMRTFVARFASFLSRTCVHRACKASLDEVLKIVFQDECFPYTDGNYLGDSEDNSRAEKCRKAAEL